MGHNLKQNFKATVDRLGFVKLTTETLDKLHDILLYRLLERSIRPIGLGETLVGFRQITIF